MRTDLEEALVAYDNEAASNWLAHSQNDPTRDALVEAARETVKALQAFDQAKIISTQAPAMDSQKEIFAWLDGKLDARTMLRALFNPCMCTPCETPAIKTYTSAEGTVFKACWEHAEVMKELPWKSLDTPATV